MAQGDEPGELLMDLEMALAPAQGRRGVPLAFEVVRGLTAGDVEQLGVPLQAAPQSLVKVSTAHHRLAQLMAQGKDNTEISMLTGYNPAYLSRLRGDPSFTDLTRVYGAERELIFADVLQRMRSLGLSSLDELQSRLAEEPEKWSKGELMALAEMCLVTPLATKGGPAASSGVNVVVSFVAPAQRLDGRAEVIDV